MPATVGLQLYTVRQLIAKSSFAAVVKEVAKIGYPGVELAGFPGTTAADAGKLLRDLGLKVTSGHFALPLGDQKQQVLDEVAAVGAKRIVSGRGPDDFKTLDLIKKSCDLFNQAGDVAAQNGLTLGIHNHWWEFQKVDGRLVFDVMREQLRPGIFFEIDVYWAKTAGADPAVEVKKAGARAPLLHIKDGPCQQGQPMTAVGAGKVDFPAIAKVSAGTADWWIVELDDCATDMMEAVRQSYRYITTNGFAKGKK